MKSVFLAVSFAALVAALPQDGYGYGYVTRVTTRVTPTPRPTTTSSCTITICADYINSCSMGYGGCYPACPGLPTPTFTPPPCPTTTKKPTKTTSKKPCQTICVDAVNECGIKYGGCYCSEEPFPYTKPPCPSKTTAKPTPTPAGPRKCGGLQGLQCKKGETCIDDPKSPCGIAVDCLGICIVEQFCGGFAGFACKNKGDVCIDDPRDDCDPKNGGADCGGLCVPKSWAY
ncbi:hypothetical protein TWF225_003228 [Orbilia oligospora]|uniref:Uncharacterized protein n=1 Tax=Orbilia oligospora TaxID=2813651 RepID=A0A7C8PX17_ORBOL|nr:hypothetical protein TWF751_005967 [Orbilia oligospora]KAF3188850.1 hypothetical protein TWF225_003228 [Orbilia oligospora]KAF3263003.1 hypothetical protein TWF128_001982 [Orbilia oligospora]KAF3267378.1 hypothetical protein TWF217_000444 [Orbilia oligospora]KAF3294394.1 hypothetical protein TWF132_003383 [Orbilia oligospora]